MARELIATGDFTQAIVEPGISADVVKTGVPSIKVKVGGSGVVNHGFSIVVTNIKTVAASIPDPGPYTVSYQATATKVKADDNLVLRERDETEVINAMPHIPGMPPVPMPVSFKYQITAAGQLLVRAE